jgi:hypothetical protein
MQIASVTTSHTGVFNTTAVNTPSVIATSVAATRGDFTTLGAPLPSGPVSYNGAYSVPVAAVSIPVLLPPAVSAPAVAPLPGITSGWAYPTGNSPEFIAKILNPVNAFLSVIADFTPIDFGAWGMTPAKMPEPPSKSTAIVPKGYFAMGYANGYLSPLDDSAIDQTRIGG